MLNMQEYTLQEGKILIDIAHKSINSYIRYGEILDIKKEFPELSENLKEKRGVFVTLKVNNELRGCIGLPIPVQSLANAVRDMAISAATQDFRFVSIKETELDELEVEISILSLPKELKLENKQDAIKLIKVGRDGLIIESDWQRGLLLPQVAVEQKWDSEQFLDNTCIKAGLHEGCWREKNTKIFTFHATIFTEKPGGTIELIHPE